MIKWALLFIVTNLVLIGCKNPQGSEQVAEKSVIALAVPDTEYKTPDGWSPNGLDSITLNYLVQNGDHIDYIFNYMPLSMNQDGAKALFQEMELISSTPIPGIPTGCFPMARKVFLADGEIIMEADLYFSDNCFFQVYIKDEKPLYGNMLSEAGIYFYINLIEQANATMPDNVKGTIKLPKGIKKEN